MGIASPIGSPVTVVGAGGIGCAVGYALCAAGQAVEFVDADEQKVAWGVSHGVAIEGWPPLPARFVAFNSWCPSSGSTVLLCTKCYDNRAVLERLPADTTLIPIQNGFDAYLEKRGLAAEGIASFVSECVPGQTRARFTRNGHLHLGRKLGPPQIALSLAGALRRHAPFSVRVVDDILPYKYTKLMYNAAISPLAAAAGLDNGRLLSIPIARRLFFALLLENYRILNESDIALARIGPFHPRTVERILRHRSLSGLLSWAFYPSLRGTYCSMSGDLPKGQTEIDYYNRRLIEIAGERPCPLNRRVYELVKRMEKERTASGLQRLEELL